MKTDSPLDTQDDNYDYDDSNTEVEVNNYASNERTNTRNIIPGGRKTVIPGNNIWDYDMGKDIVKIRPGYNPIIFETNMKRAHAQLAQMAKKRTVLPIRPHPNVWDYDAGGKDIMKITPDEPLWESNEKRTPPSNNPYDGWDLIQPEMFNDPRLQKRGPISQTHKIRPSSYFYMNTAPALNYYK